MGARTAWGWIVSALLLAGCQPEVHSVVVNVATDFTPGTDFESVRVTLESGAEVQHADQPARTDLFYPTGVRLAEFRVESDTALLATVELLDARETFVARGSVRFDARRARSVTAVISRLCRGVGCPEGRSCRAGFCDVDTCFPEGPARA